jgi:isocitrate dehydrogenase kinase/phosphatase
VFRDLPQPRCEEEEASAEPWFQCGPNDVFPEQWLQFLAIPKALQPVFLEHHAALLTAAWWRDMAARAVAEAGPGTAARLADRVSVAESAPAA